MLTKYEVEEDSIENESAKIDISKSALDRAREQARQNILEYIRNAETLQISANELRVRELNATPVRIDATPYVNYAEIGEPISREEYRIIYDEPIRLGYEPYTADMANNLMPPEATYHGPYDVQPEGWHTTPLASI